MCETVESVLWVGKYDNFRNAYSETEEGSKLNYIISWSSSDYFIYEVVLQWSRQKKQ